MSQTLTREALPQAAPPDRLAYRPPASVEEAEVMRLRLVDEVTAIQAQLGERNRLNATGQRYRPEEYWAWRSKAVGALNAKQRELRQVKAWLAGQRKESLDTFGHLKAVVYLLRDLEETVALEEPERAVLDAACAHLASYGLTVDRDPCLSGEAE